MTPVFCCGFECGLGHFTIIGTASVSTSTVRSGARSGRSNPTASSGGDFAFGNPGNSNFRVVRFYVLFATLPNANCRIFQCERAGAGNYGVGFNSTDGKFCPYVNGIFATSGGPAVSTNTWYRIDLKLTNNNNPLTIDIQVDGSAITQATSALAAANFQNVTMGVSAATVTTDAFFDDLLVSNTDTDYPIGNGKVLPFTVTGDGSHNIAGTGDFQRTLTGTDILNATTTAFQLVDDVPLESGASVDWINMVAPPNATDYVECVFGPASGVPTPTYGPRAVEVIAGIHQAGTGNGNMEIRLNDNGSMGTIYTATGVAGVTSVAYKRAHFADPPSAASVWGVASGNGNFNNVRMRFGSPAAVDANPDQYLDCIMIEAEFAEWPQKVIQVKQAIKRSNTY